MNTERKDFSPTEAVVIGRIIEARHREKVTEVRAVFMANAREAKKPLNQRNLAPMRTAGDGREVAARAVGMGASKYRQAKKVIAAAEADPDTFGDLPAQMDATA